MRPHLHGLRRRGDAGLLYCGASGRSIRQHLRGPHNHLRRHRGGAVAMPAPPPIKDMVMTKTAKGTKQYIPLQFKA